MYQSHLRRKRAKKGREQEKGGRKWEGERGRGGEKRKKERVGRKVEERMCAKGGGIKN